MSPGRALADAPWYVRFGYVMGLPALFAAFLLYEYVLVVNAKIAALESLMAAHAIDQQYLVKANAAQNERLDKFLLMLQRICVNVGDTPADDEKCFDLSKDRDRSTHRTDGALIPASFSMKGFP